jgi:sugar-specific transcriptional regulator TrmB
MEISTLLTTIGLTKTEAAVYMDLLEYGTQTISSIARTSKMHRPAIYASIPTLKEKGLISERRVGKLIHYAAEPPERLRSLLVPVHEELDALIPQLSKLQNNKTPTVRRLDGKVGVHAVYEDILRTLKKGDVFYRYSSENKKDLQRIGLPKDYETKRNEMQLERLVISNPEYIASREPALEESLKVVPKQFLPFDYHVSQIIYGDKIAFIDYSQPIATIIENPVLAKFQKDIFKMLFRKL